MKKIISLSLCAVALLVMSSCSDKFNVAAPYKNITIVYGMLDQADSVHYVRIQKAFMDENKSSLEMADVPDSSYYADGVLDVKVKEIGGINRTFNLTRVDMRNEGVTKDDGTFFTQPNYAYKFTGTVYPDRKYRLVINNKISNEVDSAETGIIDTTEQKFSADEFAYITYDMSRTRNNFTISGQVPIETAETEGARVLELLIRFHITDSNDVSGAINRYTLDWPKALSKTVDKGKASYSMSMKYLDFYNFFSTHISAAPDPKTYRKITSFDLFLFAGSYEYATYLEVTNAASTGLTGSEIKPSYSNIRGKSVIGLYTARANRFSLRKFINAETVDSLRAHPLTSNINFVWK